MKLKFTASISVLSFSLLTATAAVHECDCARPDGYAPLGVMADHYHKKGEWMTSYRYMFMSMDGNRMGDDRLSVAQIGVPGGGIGFPIVPTKMYMQMHMLGAMYAVSDSVTVMGMLPIRDIEMDHTTTVPVPGLPVPGSNFRTKASGVGDFQIGGLFKLYNRNRHSLHLNLGLSLPTGSIDETDAAPNPAAGTFSETILPYPMQLGSGTFDLRPGFTYLGQTDDWSWGAQVMATARLGENDRDYSLGNQVESSTWISRRVNEWLSGSFRMRSLVWGNINGRDAALPTVGPLGFPVETMDPNRRGGNRLDALLGINFYAHRGFLKGHRLSVEGGIPVYQYLNGPQLQTDWTLVAGWNHSF